ncbi:blr0963 [Bradyrhizobium diazoefficiens USDA 110]|uniref:Blr0963 protein n=2 Tax=Bradyrhizobium diazoefficiens TaxID=1355477 RepID=Q89VT2_BRADU|nr:peptidase S1 [Bradyrhizobium diazoefficiens]QBP19902.1 S1 family peptidase [Bradyrhizobium diazoefficiens]BAC46228.1 blr0963 [Bradyrhizobium diazoefficiens USDA 110]
MSCPRQFLSKRASMRYRQEPVRSNPPSPRLPPKRVPMKKLATPIIAALLLATPAHAIVGGGTPQADGVARAVVTIVGSRGNFCTGSLIAPKLVLTVAHCVQPGADYKIVDRGTDGQPQLLNVRTVAIHPNFNMQAMQAHRATADVALLQLEIPLKGKSAVPVGMPNIPIQVGSRFVIAGIGVTVRGDGKSGGATRVAGLVATGQPGTLQIRLVDPVTNGVRDGIGACTGDSGGPVFEDKPNGAMLVGLISWSTGPNGAAGCGGLTGVTPLTLYRDWILQTARSWGAAL